MSFIVQKHILPMFESEEKKQLRQKYNKMWSISQATGRNLGHKQYQSAGPTGSNTVYGELKLSEKLQNELEDQKNNIDNYKEQIEELEYELKCKNEEIEQLKNSEGRLKRQLADMKEEFDKFMALHRESLIRTQNLITQDKLLQQLLEKCEESRKDYNL